MKAFESLMTPSFDEIDETVPFAAEKALIANLKQAFLVLAGTGVQKFMDTIKDEQEILLAVADVAINIFAIESAVLRAEKILPGLSESREGFDQRRGQGLHLQWRPKRPHPPPARPPTTSRRGTT